MKMDDAMRAAVEAVLLDHPDVIAASLMSEESVDGSFHPVAYVVPHFERMRAARRSIYEADREKRVSQWKRAFDQTYRTSPRDMSPSFVGWTSCYTNRPLPEIEMQDWLDATAARILSLSPSNVLEIGCGVGLLVQALAPHCASYAGTDLSPVAIDNLREHVASKPELRHVTLRQSEALDLADHPSASVDTVIINSVVQYFTDIQYLECVIQEAARIVAPGGQIFIGDVRDLGTLPVFNSAVQLARAPGEASARWLRRRIALAVDHERELVIDPQFFLRLVQSDPHIERADVLVKRGEAHNELTRYRYDVVLHVGEGRTLEAEPEVEYPAGDQSAARIEAQLAADRLTTAIVRDVPNARLADDLAALRGVTAAGDRQSVQSIRDSLAAKAGSGEEPEAFWALVDEGLCELRLHWPPHSTDGRYDVALAAASNGAQHAIPRWRASDRSAPRALATDPLEAAYKQKLGLELHQMLRDRLPEASVPAAVLALSMLPSDGLAVSPDDASIRSAASADQFGD